MHGTIGNDIRRRKTPRRNDSWTFREVEIMREHWPDIEKIQALLKWRTVNAIRDMARRCGLIPPKVQHIWTAAQHSTLRRLAGKRTPRKDIAKQLGLTVQQVANRLNYSKIGIGKRPPVSLGEPLVDSVRQRAFQLKISMVDLDRSLGPRKAFQTSNVKKGTPGILHQAVKALGGRLTIEWLDE